MPDHADRSEAVLDVLREGAAFQRARCIAAFFGVRGEVDTQPLLDDPRLLLPEVRGDELVFRYPGELAAGVLGIPAPTGAEVAPEGIDLVLIPAVGIGPAGERLGQGGGYYDRFLHRTEGLRVALVFEGQRVTNVPVEPHDLRMDAVVTENGWHWF